MYLTRKLKLGRTNQLDALTRRAGDPWSTVAKWHWRKKRKSGSYEGLRPPGCGTDRTCGATRNGVPRRPLVKTCSGRQAGRPVG
jgi:hypothetical protein